MGRFSRARSGPALSSGALAPRMEVPVREAWQRLQAGTGRRHLLEQAFSPELMARGGVVALCGRMYADKSASALAVCDLRGLRAAYATIDDSRPALEPQAGLAVIVDPVSAQEPKQVQRLLEVYAGTSPVILIDRYEERLRQFVQPEVHDNELLVKLKLPNAAAIAAYLGELLQPYAHLSTLSVTDLQSLGGTMATQRFSLPQVGQVSVDAVLGALQEGQHISLPAFESAIGRYSQLRAQEART